MLQDLTLKTLYITHKMYLCIVYDCCNKWKLFM